MMWHINADCGVLKINLSLTCVVPIKWKVIYCVCNKLLLIYYYRHAECNTWLFNMSNDYTSFCNCQHYCFSCGLLLNVGHQSAIRSIILLSVQLFFSVHLLHNICRQTTNIHITFSVNYVILKHPRKCLQLRLKKNNQYLTVIIK